MSNNPNECPKCGNDELQNDGRCLPCWHEEMFYEWVEDASMKANSGYFIPTGDTDAKEEEA